MKMSGMVVVVSAALAGCGGGGQKMTFSCTVSNGTSNRCDEYALAGGKGADAENACALQGGSFSYDPCVSTGSFGRCTIKKSGDVDTMYVFPSTMVSTLSGATAMCADLDGTFQAGISNFEVGGTSTSQGPGTGLVSCTDSTSAICLQFDAASDTGSSSAASICSEVGAGSLVEGGCTLSPRLGVCNLVDADAGAYEEWVSEDYASEESTLLTDCEDSEGTWQSG